MSGETALYDRGKDECQSEEAPGSCPGADLERLCGVGRSGKAPWCSSVKGDGTNLRDVLE